MSKIVPFIYLRSTDAESSAFINKESWGLYLEAEHSDLNVICYEPPGQGSRCRIRLEAPAEICSYIWNNTCVGSVQYVMQQALVVYSKHLLLSFTCQDHISVHTSACLSICMMHVGEFFYLHVH